MRRILIVIIAVVVLLIAAVLVVPSFVDWNTYKPDLVARVEAETGRRFGIDGDIDFQILPSPQFSARQVRLSNIAGAEGDEMMRIAAVDIRVRLLPLLGGDVQVERVRLVNPVITLERLADGRPNWVFEAVEGSTAATSPEATQQSDPPEDSDRASGFRLDSLEIENGTVTIRDAASGVVASLDRVNARVSADSLAGPFASDGNFLTSGVPVAFDGTVGSIAQGKSVPLTLAVRLTEAEARFQLNGKVSEASTEGNFAGQLTLEANSAARLRVAVAGLLGSNVPRLPDVPLSLRARLAASLEEAALNDVSITLGEARASGAVSAAYADGVQLDLALALNRIDIDALLATAESEARPPVASRENAEPSAVDAPAESFVLPEDLSGSINLQVDALVYNGGIVRQLSLSATALDGVVDVSRAAALLPGGSDVTVSGSLAAVDGAPRFEGRLEAASDNLRALLAWLAVDTGAIPTDRLRKAVIGANFAVTPTVARIEEIDLRLDSSRLTGGGSFTFGERAAISADLEVDRINADAYRPPNEPSPAVAESAAPSSETEAPIEAPLAGAEAIDADLRLRIGVLTYNRTAARGLVVDASLSGGVLVVREASIQDIGGAAVTIGGRAEGLSGTPVFAGTIEIAAEDAAGLLQFLEIETPAPAARLSPLRVSGGFEAKGEALTVDLEGTAGGTRVRARGDIGADPAGAPINLSIELTNRSLAALIGQLAPTVGDGTDGAVAITGTVAGSPEALEVALHADLAGARVSIAGTVAAVEPTAFDLALEIEHPDVTGFLGDLGLDYRPAAVNLGGLELKGAVKGDANTLAVSDIAGSVGPVAVIGALEVGLGGERPRVSGNLRTSEIIADLFLPVAGGANERGATAATASREVEGGPGRWSTDPIDLGWLDFMDGDIALSSRAIDYGRYRFGEPSLKLVLQDGVLDIAPLTGTLYGGTVELTARLDNAAVPTIALSLRLDDADLEQALIEGARIDRVTGRLALSAQLSAEGSSQLELIEALAGDGRFSASDGTIRGIDLGRLSDRLKRLNEITDYLGLIQASFSGGATAYSVLDGSFQISEGIIRSSDLQMRLDGAMAEGTGVVDLPRWLIDLRTRARLVEHPDAPTVGLDLSGSLDSPRRDIRTSELESYIAARVGGSVLRKLLPDLLDDEDSDRGTAPAAGDAVESLLKGLLKRLGD